MTDIPIVHLPPTHLRWVCNSDRSVLWLHGAVVGTVFKTGESGGKATGIVNEDFDSFHMAEVAVWAAARRKYDRVT